MAFYSIALASLSPVALPTLAVTSLPVAVTMRTTTIPPNMAPTRKLVESIPFTNYNIYSTNKKVYGSTL